MIVIPYIAIGIPIAFFVIRALVMGLAYVYSWFEDLMEKL
jgi:hypothetical protein